MLITIQNKFHLPVATIRTKILLTSRYRVCLYPFKVTEIEIDEYLKKNFNTTLRQACLNILNKCTVTKADDDEASVTVTDPQLDQIASIINYGPDGKCGSKILKYALKV